MKTERLHLQGVAHVTKEECMPRAVQAAATIAGGMTALAKLLGIDRGVVYNWSRAGRVPIEPFNYAAELETRLSLPRWFMRPDVYDWPRGAAVVTPIGTFLLSE